MTSTNWSLVHQMSLSSLNLAPYLCLRIRWSNTHLFTIICQPIPVMCMNQIPDSIDADQNVLPVLDKIIRTGSTSGLLSWLKDPTDIIPLLEILNYLGIGFPRA